MADIAAADLTYTVQDETKRIGESGRREAVYLVSFGDATDTYPTGGVPLTKAKLGCPNDLEELLFVDSGSGDGYVYKFEKGDDTIRIYTADYDATADGALIEFSGGATAVPATTLYVKAVGW